jgi:hypothetical protein
MITLTAPLTLPAPFNETLANATLVSARLDLHNQQVDLVFAFGNGSAGSFLPSPNLPGVPVNISLRDGAVYVRGNLKGWVSAATLAAIQSVISNFVKGAESLATGITITLPGPDGSPSGNTQQVALMPGTIA